MPKQGHRGSSAQADVPEGASWAHAKKDKCEFWRGRIGNGRAGLEWKITQAVGGPSKALWPTYCCIILMLCGQSFAPSQETCKLHITSTAQSSATVTLGKTAAGCQLCTADLLCVTFRFSFSHLTDNKSRLAGICFFLNFILF